MITQPYLMTYSNGQKVVMMPVDRVKYGGRYLYNEVSIAADCIEEAKEKFVMLLMSGEIEII